MADPIEDSSPRGHDLLRSNAVVALGTGLSRLTGMLKVIVFGFVIGQTALADAYDGANNSPNAVYELLLGGVLSATLVPLFTRLLEDDDRDGAEAVVGVSIIALTVITAIAVVFAPWIFRIFSLSPDAAVDANDFRTVGTALTRIFLLQIFFYGIAAVLGALLNAQRRFFAAAWSPVLANVVIICSLLYVPTLLDHEAPVLRDVLDSPSFRWLLGLGATGGIALQALILLPAIHQAGLNFRFRFRPLHPAVKRLFALSGWTFGYVLANQVTVVIVKNLAVPGSGGQDAYAKASTFFYFPHGLLAMSIATTFIPEMARAVARRDRDAFVDRTALGVRLVGILTIPAAFGFLALARPIVGALLQHGQFDSAAADTTSRALAGLSLGLIGYSIYLFALRGFYAHQDTRTPFVINLGQNALNIVLAFALVGPFDVLGLGLAFAISYLAAAVVTLLVLRIKVPTFPAFDVLTGLSRVVVAGAAMGAVVWLAVRAFGDDDGGGAVLRLVAGTGVGVITYLGALQLLRAPEIEHLRTLRRRLRGLEPDAEGDSERPE
ncbi:MAG: murein biosynthesis integral membrane protein MurJ [Actinomycetota bacterium]|nr:murein biosynthesis integral membrane protein MurJ [Actinomycetota bacterium]MDA2971464.1 murein biosynthesis integral membrane protein MurJ [Actinomycetota bacterium]MDA3000753.1 murein biosynthesis integral membrane protein MurJ [Actinomycetota bacterium]